MLFLGRRSDVAEIMQAMDVFVLPSRFEGLGLVLIEAQTAGLKCFASVSVPREARVTGNLEFLEFDADKCAEKIIAHASGYYRIDCTKQITEAGYALSDQIRVLEKLYSED